MAPGLVNQYFEGNKLKDDPGIVDKDDVFKGFGSRRYERRTRWRARSDLRV